MANREEEYAKLVEEIKSCTRCKLHLHRRNAVPGEGPIDADVMLVGEAPGRNEDLQGRPFVGAAGKLLNELLGLAGLSRDQVYITNVVKCRPPGNRDPEDDEIEACLPYLLRQISLIQPRLIVALGRFAARTLLGLMGIRWHSMSRQHGTVYEGVIAGVRVRVVVTYHPAAALYKPPIRRALEHDFGKIIGGEVARLRRGGGARQLTLDSLLSRAAGEGGDSKHSQGEDNSLHH